MHIIREASKRRRHKPRIKYTFNKIGTPKAPQAQKLSVRSTTDGTATASGAFILFVELFVAYKLKREKETRRVHSVTKTTDQLLGQLRS